jgi:hypothetical protein
LICSDFNNGSDSVTFNLDVNVIYSDAGTVISSNSRTIALPDSIPPGESYTFSSASLSSTGTSVAGVSFQINTFCPSSDSIHVDSDNFMSYYSYVGCDQFFTPDQVDAVALDYAQEPMKPIILLLQILLLPIRLLLTILPMVQWHLTQ